MSEQSPDAIHVPVLADRCVDLLAPAMAAPGAIAVDATLGLGGHSELLLTRFPEALVVGIDRDPEALARSRARLAPFGDRFVGVHAVYDEVGEVVADVAARTGAPGAAGVLFDLGVSSMQLDLAERGFAYSQDAPLDMRMDQSAGMTAAELLATAPEGEIRRILFAYGEEKFAGRIAGAIVRRREAGTPVERSGDLVDLIRDNIPAPARRRGGNPAKRTFQALRVAVNDELEVLRRALPAALASLVVGGRLVVMSYQSLEDRIVKRLLVERSTSTAPPGLPVVPAEHAPSLKLLTRGAEDASADEIESNPRAASVRLRAAEVLRPQEGIR